MYKGVKRVKVTVLPISRGDTVLSSSFEGVVSVTSLSCFQGHLSSIFRRTFDRTHRRPDPYETDARCVLRIWIL